MRRRSNLVTVTPALPGVASRRLSDRSGAGHEPSSRSTEAVGAQRPLLKTTATRLFAFMVTRILFRLECDRFMLARSLSGIHLSAIGLGALRGILPAGLGGGVCPASGSGAGSVVSQEPNPVVGEASTRRFSRRYHEIERLTAWRGRDSKDPGKSSAQTGGAGPGP